MDPVAQLVARFEDELRRAAWTIVDAIVRAEHERRMAVLNKVGQALDAALAKAHSQSTKSSDGLARTRARRAAAEPRVDGEVSAADATPEHVVVTDAPPSPPKAAPARTPASERLAGARAQRDTASARSRDDEAVFEIDPRVENATATVSSPPASARARRADWEAWNDGEAAGTSPQLEAGVATGETPSIVSARANDRVARARERRAAIEGRGRGEVKASAIEPQHEEPARTIGTVKWFNETKGFGFIIAPDGADVFVHYKHVAGGGFRTLDEGATVSYLDRDGPRGRFATDVRPAEVAH